MPKSSFRMRAFILFLFCVAFIVFLSLYPFEYRIRFGSEGPWIRIIGSAYRWPGPRDFLLNILFYMPLGYFGLRALPAMSPVARNLMLALLFGALFSTANELAQYYVGRHTSFFDVFANATGSFLGALVGHYAWSRQERGSAFQPAQNKHP